MILFLSGAVNPNSWEIAAALCVWTSSLALLFAADTADDSRLLARVGIAAVVLVSMRSLSPLWLALALLLVVGGALRARFLEVVHRRSTIAWAAAVLIATLLSVGWTIQFRVFELGHHPVSSPVGLMSRVEASLLLVPGRLREMVGVFGWLDTNSPELTYALWSAGVGAVVFLGLASAAGRPRAALIGAIALTIAVPIAVEVPGANEYGFAWQGRYTLPLAVGVPILAGLAAAVGETLSTQAALRLTVWLALMLAVAHFCAFWWMLLRYQVGVGHGLNPLPGSWHPPGGSLLILVAYAVGLLSWGVLDAFFRTLLRAPPSPSPQKGGGGRAALQHRGDCEIANIARMGNMLDA
jgi:hypothetical protein